MNGTLLPGKKRKKKKKAHDQNVARVEVEVKHPGHRGVGGRVGTCVEKLEGRGHLEDNRNQQPDFDKGQPFLHGILQDGRVAIRGEWIFKAEDSWVLGVKEDPRR